MKIKDLFEGANLRFEANPDDKDKWNIILNNEKIGMISRSSDNVGKPYYKVFGLTKYNVKGGFPRLSLAKEKIKDAVMAVEL